MQQNEECLITVLCSVWLKHALLLSLVSLYLAFSAPLVFAASPQHGHGLVGVKLCWRKAQRRVCVYQKHDADTNGNQGSEGLEICAGTGSYRKRERGKDVWDQSVQSQRRKIERVRGKE